MPNIRIVEENGINVDKWGQSCKTAKNLWITFRGFNPQQ